MQQKMHTLIEDSVRKARMNTLNSASIITLNSNAHNIAYRMHKFTFHMHYFVNHMHYSVDQNHYFEIMHILCTQPAHDTRHDDSFVAWLCVLPVTLPWSDVPPVSVRLAGPKCSCDGVIGC